MNAKGKEKQEAIEYLRKTLKPGDTIYTTLEHVSRSGMYRVISLFVMRDNEPLRISWAASKLLEGYDEKWKGCKAGGCGMDMGFHLVHNLGYVLFSEGFTCIGDHCPSNDHVNGDRDYTPHLHSSGGYVFTQRWL